MLFNYPVEKNCLRFYRFTFLGYKEPITVEAYNKVQAKILLRDFVLKTPALQNKPIINLGIAIPIVGETTKIVNNVELVYIPNGWMPLFEYKRRADIE
jgi:hypothetical protein